MAKNPAGEQFEMSFFDHLEELSSHDDRMVYRILKHFLSTLKALIHLVDHRILTVAEMIYFHIIQVRHSSNQSKNKEEEAYSGWQIFS